MPMSEKRGNLGTLFQEIFDSWSFTSKIKNWYKAEKLQKLCKFGLISDDTIPNIVFTTQETTKLVSTPRTGLTVFCFEQ